MTVPPRFWESKALSDLNEAEWESLCDGCARCCLHKLEDVDTGVVHYSKVACRLLDLSSCRCGDYSNRHERVPDCVRFDAAGIGGMDWMPKTCAYRILATGGELSAWHPLISGNRNSVVDAGISIRGFAVSATEDTDLELNLIDWID